MPPAPDLFSASWWLFEGEKHSNQPEQSEKDAPPFPKCARTGDSAASDVVGRRRSLQEFLALRRLLRKLGPIPEACTYLSAGGSASVCGLYTPLEGHVWTLPLVGN